LSCPFVVPDPDEDGGEWCDDTTRMRRRVTLSEVYKARRECRRKMEDAIYSGNPAIRQSIWLAYGELGVRQR
jgi:hypothetical protein